MNKEKTKTVTPPVGVAVHGNPFFEEKTKTQKGITLIALIITIIVMLILVGVTISVSINGGLFSKAKEATEGTQTGIDEEQLLSAAIGAIGNNGKVDFKKLDANLPEGFTGSNGTYTSKSGNTYTVNGNGSISLKGEELEVILPEGWTETTTPATWTKADGTINDKVIAITDGTYTLPLPEGYTVSQEYGEYAVSEGLVITDGENEFVWIPIAADKNFENPYNYSSSYSEPRMSSYYTDDTITSYYGENYYTMANNFNLSAHYAEMKASVEKYDGFYIGRYETTIDGNKIGSKENATVLTCDRTLSGTTYPYRWWGLYDSQRKANVKGNGSIVQTNMIWGQQWDAMITFFDNEDKDYSATPVTTLATSGKQNAGQAKYTYDNETISDEICNIYDLRSNVLDLTAEDQNGSTSPRGRVLLPK